MLLPCWSILTLTVKSFSSSILSVNHCMPFSEVDGRDFSGSIYHAVEWGIVSFLEIYSWVTNNFLFFNDRLKLSQDRNLSKLWPFESWIQNLKNELMVPAQFLVDHCSQQTPSQ